MFKLAIKVCFESRVGLVHATVETHTKEPIFIRNLRRKFNILNLLNKNLSDADTGRASYITGAMSSDFLITFDNS